MVLRPRARAMRMAQFKRDWEKRVELEEGKDDYLGFLTTTMTSSSSFPSGFLQIETGFKEINSPDPPQKIEEPPSRERIIELGERDFG